MYIIKRLFSLTTMFFEERVFMLAFFIAIVIFATVPSSAQFTNSATTVINLTAMNTIYKWTGTVNNSSSTAEYLDGTVRENLSSNPSIEADTTNWSPFANGGVVAASRQVAGGASGSSFYRLTWMTPPTTIQGGITHKMLEVTPGAIYSASVSVRSNNAQRIQIGLKWYDDNGKLTSVDNGGTSLMGNVWTKLTLNDTAPVGATELRITLYATPGTGARLWVAGDTLDTDAMIIEKAPTTGVYFDGSSTD